MGPFNYGVGNNSNPVIPKSISLSGSAKPVAHDPKRRTVELNSI